MDSTTTACIAVAMLSFVLLCVVLMKRPLDEQLQAIANGQASLADKIDRVEERIKRLGHKVDRAISAISDQNAWVSSPRDEEAGATDPRAAAQPSSSSMPHDRPREHRQKLHKISGSFPSPSPAQNAPRNALASTPPRTSREPQTRISSGNRFYSHIVESRAGSAQIRKTFSR